jgi:alcohol dehydrogenase
MSNLLNLRKFVAPESIFGAGARHMVAQYVKNLGGNRAFIVSDPGVVKAGWVAEVERDLQDSQIAYYLFTQVTPNPRDTEIEQGARAFIEHDCDVIVAVGGGSPMDCAKGIGVVVGNHREIGSFEGVDQVNLPGPPLICIPTTSGTAADLSQFAIVTSLDQRRKYAIISKTVVPDVALIDPETNTTKDSYLTACTGIDSLVHAIEAYVSSASSALTDTHALTAIELLNTGLPEALEKPYDVAVRAKVALGCMHAGLAFSNASLGAVHAMAHSLGGFLDLPHGECNAILLRHVMAFNAPIAAERFDQIGHKLGLDFRGMTEKQRSRAVLKAVEELTRRVGIIDKLGSKGVRSGDIPDLSNNAMVDPCMITNPRIPNKRDIETVYEEAL